MKFLKALLFLCAFAVVFFIADLVAGLYFLHPLAGITTASVLFVISVGLFWATLGSLELYHRDRFIFFWIFILTVFGGQFAARHYYLKPKTTAGYFASSGQCNFFLSHWGRFVSPLSKEHHWIEDFCRTQRLKYMIDNRHKNLHCRGNENDLECYARVYRVLTQKKKLSAVGMALAGKAQLEIGKRLWEAEQGKLESYNSQVTKPSILLQLSGIPVLTQKLQRQIDAVMNGQDPQAFRGLDYEREVLQPALESFKEKLGTKKMDPFLKKLDAFNQWSRNQGKKIEENIKSQVNELLAQ